MQTVIESNYFIKTAEKLLREDERVALVNLIAANPSAGALVKGTTAIRKLRIGRDGMGKRGGARVIYFFHNNTMPTVMLEVYAKNDKDDLSAAQKQQMTDIALEIMKQFGR